MFGSSDIGVVASIMYSILGMAIVFLMLIFLWAIIELMARVLVKKETKTVTVPVVETPTKTVDTATNYKTGAVSDKDAAMLMAIVAENMKIPLRQLRFKSIREVDEDEV